MGQGLGYVVVSAVDIVIFLLRRRRRGVSDVGTMVRAIRDRRGRGTYTCQDAVQPVENMTLDNHCRLRGIVSSCGQAASSQDVVAVRGVSSWRPGTLKVHHPHTPPALAVVEAPSSFGQAGRRAGQLLGA